VPDEAAVLSIETCLISLVGFRVGNPTQRQHQTERGKGKGRCPWEGTGWRATNSCSRVLHGALTSHLVVFAKKGLRRDSRTLYDSETGDTWRGSDVASVRFAWNPMLVNLRREICPGAQWQKNGRQWIMSDTEADTFVRAAQARLDFGKLQAQIRVDNVIWVVGFVRGAPYRLSASPSERVT
jgi:hypothetical protein